MPVNTLRDRITGRVSVDITSSGQPPLFDQEEESLLVEHIKTMANLGYGYTRSEVVELTSKFAVDIGKREEGSDLLTMPWYYNFMKRWPELHNVKPQSLSELRARAASKDSIDNYYTELDRILTLYNLKDKPHCIYNVDEKAVMIGAGKVPNIVAPKGSKAQTVTSERGQNVTAIGCGNAAGASIPPYLVFPDKRMLPELLKDATPGCDGSVSSTGKGYSNTDIFSTYVKSHFFKYVQGRDPDQHVLLMYDGHRSHISLSLIEWAKQNKIILFVLPPHTSHILQPMDVGCFGPFEVLYQAEVKKITRQKSGTSVTRYDICGLVCKVYDKALQGDNLRAAFRRTGIYPLKKTAVSEDQLMPSLVFKGRTNETEHASKNENTQTALSPISKFQKASDFLQKKDGDVLEAATKAKKPRRNISTVVAGKAITEDEVFEKIQEYKSVSNQSKSKSSKKQLKTKCNSKTTKKQSCPESKTERPVHVSCNDSPQPSTSGLNKILISPVVSEDFSESDDDNPDGKCCICERTEPPQLKDLPYIAFVNWANCDKCLQWVHLKFCVPQRVVRKDTVIICPHCSAS